MQWTWVWANSGRCWRTGKLGVHRVSKSQTQLSNRTATRQLPDISELLIPSSYKSFYQQTTFCLNHLSRKVLPKVWIALPIPASFLEDEEIRITLDPSQQGIKYMLGTETEGKRFCGLQSGSGSRGMKVPFIQHTSTCSYHHVVPHRSSCLSSVLSVVTQQNPFNGYNSLGRTCMDSSMAYWHTSLRSIIYINYSANWIMESQ